MSHAVLMVSLTSELVLFTASLTGGINNQPMAFGDHDTDGVSKYNQPTVAYQEFNYELGLKRIVVFSI